MKYNIWMITDNMGVAANERQYTYGFDINEAYKQLNLIEKCYPSPQYKYVFEVREDIK